MHRQRGAADAGGRERGARGQVAQRLLAGDQRLRGAGHAAGHAHHEVDVHVPAGRQAVLVEQALQRGRAGRGRRSRTRARCPRSCMRVCSSTMNSQRFRKTSSPKLTVPIVQEAMSGPASSTASRSASGIGHRAAGGQLHDQVGAGRAAPRRSRAAGPGRAWAGPRRRGCGRGSRWRRAPRTPWPWRPARPGSPAAPARRALATSAPVGATVISVLCHGSSCSGRVDRARSDSPTRSAASSATFCLTSARAIRPSSWWRTAVPTNPTAPPVQRHRRARRGQLVGGDAVEVQQHQPARRPAEVVHPGHRLLAAVAALLQVDGRRPSNPASAGSVRWSVSKPSRGRRAATRIASYAQMPASGTPAPATISSSAVARHQQVGAAGDPAGPALAEPRRTAYTRRSAGPARAPAANFAPGTGEHVGRRPAARRRAPASASSVPGPTSDSTAHSAVTSAGSTRIMNRIRSRKSSSARGAGLDVEPGGRRRPRSTIAWCSTWPCGESTSSSVPCHAGSSVEVLGGEAVQPGQPVVAGHREHAAVRPVDQADLGRRAGAARASGRRSARRRRRRGLVGIERRSTATAVMRSHSCALGRTRRTARRGRCRPGSRARRRSRSRQRRRARRRRPRRSRRSRGTPGGRAARSAAAW